MGIVGCGHIGKDLVPLLKAFDCRILAHDILEFPDFYALHGVESVGLDALLRRADIVTLHVPLNDGTRGLLNAERLALLKPDAVLINAARGGLVDEQELKRMLLDKRLAAAAFDVSRGAAPGSGALGAPQFPGDAAYRRERSGGDVGDGPGGDRRAGCQRCPES